jgi:transposase
LHAQPDWSALVRELKRPGVNLLVLWDEYRAIHPGGHAYSRFCQLFREFERRLSATMRLQHVAGDKAFVDYSGKRVPIADRAIGELRWAEIFVAVLGASNLTYAEATWTQTLPDWIGAHVRMFRFDGSAPRLLVPEMQSIFSPAARCTSVSLPGTQRRRDGGLKMDWTKPPAPHSPPGAWELGQHMGIE